MLLEMMMHEQVVESTGSFQGSALDFCIHSICFVPQSTKVRSIILRIACILTKSRTVGLKTFLHAIHYVEYVSIKHRTDLYWSDE